MTDVKVDLPKAWKSRNQGAYAALFAIVSLVPSMVVTYVVGPMCLTSTDRSGSIDDYILTRCPIAMGARDGEGEGHYLNMTAGAW